MATYEEIKAANDTIKTTDIKGKDYAEVPQRIKAFRMVYPNGTIETIMLKDADGVCVFRAVIRDGENLLGTGTAYEKEGSSFINQSSYIENCETSAVGRALGMAGFGIDTSVASAEEVQNAMLNQNQKPQQTRKQPTPQAAPYIPQQYLQQEPPQEQPQPVQISEDAKAAVLDRMSMNADAPKASPKQVEILRQKYTGKNLEKLLTANGVSQIEDIPLKKASELIEKIMRKEAAKGE